MCVAGSAGRKKKAKNKTKRETKALDGEVLTVGLPSGDRYLSTPLIQGDFLAASEGHLRPNEGASAIDKACFYRRNCYFFYYFFCHPPFFFKPGQAVNNSHPLQYNQSSNTGAVLYTHRWRFTVLCWLRADNHETCNRREKEPARNLFFFFPLLDFYFKCYLSSGFSEGVVLMVQTPLRSGPLMYLAVGHGTCGKIIRQLRRGPLAAGRLQQRSQQWRLNYVCQLRELTLL